MALLGSLDRACTQWSWVAELWVNPDSLGRTLVAGVYRQFTAAAVEIDWLTV